LYRSAKWITTGDTGGFATLKRRGYTSSIILERERHWLFLIVGRANLTVANLVYLFDGLNRDHSFRDAVAAIAGQDLERAEHVLIDEGLRARSMNGAALAGAQEFEGSRCIEGTVRDEHISGGNIERLSIAALVGDLNNVAFWITCPIRQSEASGLV
jgi:hypothetical protein